jgi:acyl-CoA synthetase (AMP-forming)/AMP-acid ligase II
MIAARTKTPADRCLSLARAAYSQGFNSIMIAISVGGSLVITPRADVKALPHWLQTYRPTYLSTTPAVLRAIAADLDPDLLAVFQQSSLTSIHSSAGPLTEDDLSRLESLLGVPILNGYGLSEASGIALEPWPRARRVPGSAGLPQCDIRIVDEASQELAHHEIGEIVVCGPQVFPGYLDDPAANAAAFLPGGWFRTGDVGFVDAAGYLHLTGRLGETINRGGEKIVPDEVDAVLRNHPAVADAAVFAVPDPILGEDVVAAVVLKSGMRIERRALRGWLLDRLPLFKVPRRIWLVEALPRTRTGKVQRGELAQHWREDHGSGPVAQLNN